MTAVEAVNRPTAVSGGVSVLAATVVVGLVVPTGSHRVTLGLELGSLAVLVGGLVLCRRGHRSVGIAGLGVGTVAWLGVLGVAISQTSGLDEMIVTVPGVVGIAAVTLGIAPVRGDGSRTLVKLGAGAVFVSVLGAGLFRLVAPRTLLIATAGTVVVWDAGDRAISLGEQLGRVARTRRLEAVRAGGTLLVGAVAVVLAPVVEGFGSSGLPLSALAALLVAVLLLTAALHG